MSMSMWTRDYRNTLTQRLPALYSHLGYHKRFYYACETLLNIPDYNIDFSLYILLLNELIWLLLLPVFKVSGKNDTVELQSTL